jgi:hypothetical protein
VPYRSTEYGVKNKKCVNQKLKFVAQCLTPIRHSLLRTSIRHSVLTPPYFPKKKSKILNSKFCALGSASVRRKHCVSTKTRFSNLIFVRNSKKKMKRP